MTYLINNIIVPLQQKDTDFDQLALRALRCRRSDLKKVWVYRRSVDARKKENIKLSYTLAAEVEEDVKINISAAVRPLQESLPEFTPGSEVLQHRPVIVGFGPAGIFCGLMLAREGYRPIILEQGAPMPQRVADVEHYWKNGVLNTASNIQYGEGGAGTFSDGKLMTRINDGFCRLVLQELVDHGAPEEILVQAKPHIGTDLLRNVVVALRKEIIDLGGEVRFHTEVTDILLENGKIAGVVTNEGEIPCECVVFAIGNAARGLFRRSLQRGIAIESKPFSVGVRIEHLQHNIDEAMYGRMAGHPLLGHAEYQLSQRDAATGRAVYTFCMCPGGVVVPSASEENTIVTNGMSYHGRAGKNANAALVVSVDQRDFGSHPLDGMLFQQQIETAAYAATGSYRAPVQTVGRFLAGESGAAFGGVQPTYAMGTEPCDLRTLLPQFVTEQMASGLAVFGRRIAGYDTSDAVLTAPETRTSSPVRLPRGEDRQSISTPGLYPCGEGGGYAGGIMSSAVDGIHTAEAIISRYRPD